jgi:hypothetical protein
LTAAFRSEVAMRSWRWLLLLPLATALAGCEVTPAYVSVTPPAYTPPAYTPPAVTPTPVAPVPVVTTPGYLCPVPPPPQPETQPLPPVSEQQLTWQPGHWDWNGANYVWSPGRWVLLAGHGRLWQPGYWAPGVGGCTWVPAHWAAR